MADLNVALILKLVDRATGPARAAMRAIERMGGDGLVRQAQRAQAASAMIAGGVGSIAGAATRGGLAVAAYGAGISALAASFVRPAAQFEQFNVQLTALEGSAEKAATAMAWIEDFATRTPLELEDTVAAYAKLKAFGLDPTEGSLQALVDTMAASGGGAEQLNGLVLALGQSWTKGKLQGEEAMQMLERGVPVWDLLSAKLGKTNAELIEMASAGELGREEILLLVEALAEQNAGASEAMSKTWGGITSNLRDHWTRFQRMVMASGLFDWMKGQLEDLLDTLNTMTENGQLQAWAETVGTAIKDGLIGLRDFGADVYGMLDRIQAALGGWDILGWTAAMALFAPQLVAVASGIKAIAVGLALLSLNPLTLLLLAVAAAAYLIYRNWDGITEWFADKWERVSVDFQNAWNSITGYFIEKIERIKAAFDVNLFEGVFQTLREVNPFHFIMQKAEEFYTYLTGMTFEETDRALMDMFAGIDLMATGARIMQSLWDGMKGIMAEMVAWATAKLESITPKWMTATYGAEGVADDTDFTGGAGRALGGPVRAGGIYQWQEEGRELFVPATDGTVISNRQLRAMRGGGGRSGPSFTIGAINITAAAGQSARDVALAVRRELEDMARAAPLHDGGGYGD